MPLLVRVVASDLLLARANYHMDLAAHLESRRASRDLAKDQVEMLALEDHLVATVVGFHTAEEILAVAVEAIHREGQAEILPLVAAMAVAMGCHMEEAPSMDFLVAMADFHKVSSDCLANWLLQHFEHRR